MILDENEIISKEKEDTRNYLRYIKILGISVFINGSILATLALFYFFQELTYITIDLFFILPSLFVGFICFVLMFSGYKLFSSNGDLKQITTGIKGIILIWLLIVLLFFISIFGINVF